ncbi:MAG: glycosyltransferase family 2 protein [Bacteroides sp.]|nr:glycosyltransferase family 2 protein [Roseburia sp.]MCM1346016.1 glycosyltransferase family 2 protein [Bacteroides sp.]MCM1421482.1 glycosyltransferase family 2 protein [Bacteroides sp.]
MISVIIPIYNVERYLRRCIDSILAQTFTDFELLLVDDGSKDGSGSICDEYAEKDKRVRVFHKANGGVSSARNMGLDHAWGEWITFVDSDDWVDSDYLNEYNKHFDRYADLYIQGFKDNEGHTMCWKEQYWEGEGIACRLQCLEPLRLYGFVWNKLFCSSIIKENNLRFDERITMIEDTLFIHHYLFYAKSVLNLPFTHYFYFTHTDSASLSD